MDDSAAEPIMSGFAKLPRELTDEIFCYISRTDLFNISLTCRTLYDKSVSSINRFLKISILAGTNIKKTRAKKIFSKAFTDVSLEYLRELEVCSVLKQGIHPSNLDIRHIYVVQNINSAVGHSGSGSEDECSVETSFNLNLRDLLSRLPPRQLKKFSCYSPLNLKNLSEDKFFEPQTLSTLFSPENMLTTLNISIPHSMSSDCSIFHVPHLTSFTFYAEDFTVHYHSIFSILYSCQKTLKEFYCNNKRYLGWRPARTPADRLQETSFYMHEGFVGWKGCTKCGQDNPLSTPANRRIRLTELKLWRIDGMGHMMTDVFGPYHLVQDSPLMDVEVAIGALAFVGLKASNGGTLQLQRLLEHANGTRGSPNSEGLETYFRYTRGLVGVTLSFHENLGLDWLVALEGSANTLKHLHLTSVFGDLSFAEDDIEGLGKSFQKLEMLTISSACHLPNCILNSQIFPRLKYFGNRAYPHLDVAVKDKLENLLRIKCTETGLSSSLRLIRFRLPGQNYLIERGVLDDIGGNPDIRIEVIEDYKVPSILRGIGEAPKFG
ncbi:hypothetical protein TWF506_007539 [Arthrobotrys conoides]|uniref:F-box domain-containing protein n=1 Tax=Arthrobotrys conoides TaxID=74498 RepID=A0AAN8NPA8_9PEZI